MDLAAKIVKVDGFKIEDECWVSDLSNDDSTNGGDPLGDAGECRSNETQDLVDFLLENRFEQLSYEDKITIRRHGCPRPHLSIRTHYKNENRSFKVHWYEKFSWLTGSTLRDKMYCWPCLLFARQRDSDVWIKKGYSDLKNLPSRADKHSKSLDHISSTCKYELFGKQIIGASSAWKNDIERYNSKVKENRAIIKRLVDVTLYLCRRGLFSRELDGNLKELVVLLSKYDRNFRVFLDDSSEFSISSKTIRSDIIDSIIHVVRDEIDREIHRASFFSWQVDEMTDIDRGSRSSVIFRYLVNDKVVERFVGFYDLGSDRTSDALFESLLENFGKYNLKTKLIAQTYNTAAVDGDRLNRLQAKIKSVAPFALLTHCHAHNLNSILSKACDGIKSVQIFFSNLRDLSSFFDKLTKRPELFEEICAGYLLIDVKTCNAVQTVHSNREKLIELFDLIVDNKRLKNDDLLIREAIGLRKFLFDANFLFYLETFKIIFEKTNAVFSTLGNKTPDMTHAKNMIDELIEKLKDIRENETYFDDAYSFLFNVSEEPVSKKRKTTNNNDLNDNIKCEYKENFIQIMDMIISQIELRFLYLEKLKFCSLIIKNKFYHKDPIRLQALIDNLFQQYPFFTQLQLKNELLAVYCEPELLGGCETPNEMLSFIYNNLKTCLPEMMKLLEMILTLPLTAVSDEQSVSTLERVKTYSRNTTAQNGLGDVSIICIEREYVTNLCEDESFYEKVIDFFAKKKDHEIPLLFKNS